ncbi:hypothetical protein [Mycobacterium sp.]|uniref:hypothetical protein n=1 Tax=Mycobacterium sp. TaxID=1785 RepID=UPI003BB1149C
MTEFERKVLKLFRAAIGFLRIDDEGCAPSEWQDVVKAANLCRDIRLWSLGGFLPELAKSDAFFEAVDALEMVLATYAVVSADNPEVVARWRNAMTGIAELEAA